ncbi:MAG: methylated-DNA--[protein]-cysteine S-methyltransferase [Nevskia sp.]|nr:methylated-DNA--[protein]-cysteine S-methyltransferase [Nevskia sp.]
MNEKLASTYYSLLPSPIGDLLLLSDGEHLTGLYMRNPRVADGCKRDDAGLAPARAELRAYFAGELREFAVPYALAGTPFQRRVWSELARIPYGTTISYGELARRLGDPKASRAVGLANGRNPVSIVVPCHRVIGADGSLTGYGGGIERKQWLLRHEGVLPAAADLFAAAGAAARP